MGEDTFFFLMCLNVNTCFDDTNSVFRQFVSIYFFFLLTVLDNPIVCLPNTIRYVPSSHLRPTSVLPYNLTILKFTIWCEHKVLVISLLSQVLNNVILTEGSLIVGYIFVSVKPLLFPHKNKF